jgi:hypothetical protein
VAKTLEEDLSQAIQEADTEHLNAFDIVRHAARGAVHAAGEMVYDVGHLAQEAFVGVMGASGTVDAEPEENLKAAGQGVMQGAAETGADLGEVACRAIDAAREVARQIGLPEEVAARRAAEGVLEAAEAVGPEAVAKVKSCLPPDLLSKGEDAQV